MGRILLVGVILMGICGCAVPGTVTYKYVNNRWEPDTATFSKSDITPGEIKSTQDRLNGK